MSGRLFDVAADRPDAAPLVVGEWVHLSVMPGAPGVRAQVWSQADSGVWAVLVGRAEPVRVCERARCRVAARAARECGAWHVAAPPASDCLF